jgi:O-antigen/teichoic acid export membrane protein
VLRNIGSNWVLTILTIAAMYFLTPFVIHTLGKEGYGTWTLITSMTGYMSLLALGVPMACVRYLAQDVAAGDTDQVRKTVGSCAALYLMMGAFAFIVGLVLVGLFTLYDIPAGLHIDAMVAFGLMVIQVSAGFIGLLPEGIMFAHHDFVARNAVRIAGVMLRLVLTVGVLMLDASLTFLALVQLACLGFDFGASMLLVRRRYPHIRISLVDFDWRIVRRIFSFSGYVLLLSAGARLTFETDALVIGAMLGVGFIPFFAVANSLVIYLMEFVVAIAAVVSPMATKLSTEGKRDELREIFLKWSKVSLSLSMLAGLFLMVLGPRFIGWWIDPSFEQPSGEVLQILMVSCFFFLPVRGVALPILMGLGKPKAPTLAFLATGFVNLGLSIALAPKYGLAGVALGTALPNILFSVFVLALACRELDVSLARYVRYVVPRAAAGALPVIILLLWFKLSLQVQTLVGLAAAGSAVVVLFALTWIFFVYRDDPYVDLRGHVLQLRRWSRA